MWAWSEKNIILYGAGKEAINIYYNLCRMGKKDKIKYIIDGGDAEYFFEYKIYHNIDEIADSKLYNIIVATAYEAYKNIVSVLAQKGFIEHVDFVWGKLIDKKIVLVHANCHAESVVKFLESSTEFNRNYIIYPLPLIHLNTEKRIDENLMKIADVFIHQDIRRGNCISYELSDEYLLSKLSQECVNICIPNLVGYGTAVHQWQIAKICTLGPRNTAIVYRDIFLDEAFQRSDKIHLDSMLKEMNNYKYDVENIKSKFWADIERLRKREKNWDIKIADYILEVFPYEPIFNDRDHPSSFLMNKICKEIAHKIHIFDLDDKEIELEVGIESFIWHMLKDSFELKWSKKYVGGQYGTDKLSYEEYIRKYVWGVYGIYLK